MLIIGPSGLGKSNALLNLGLQFLIKKGEDAGIKNLDDPTAFIEYSNTMDDVYNNIDDCNTRRKRKILIVLDNLIADIMTNKKFQAIIK